MNRSSDFVPLVVLAGIGWACAFAVIGLCIFAHVPDNLPLAAVFGAFGFAAGGACTALRMVSQRQLPMELAASLRRPSGDSEAEPGDAAAPAAVSAFGA